MYPRISLLCIQDECLFSYQYCVFRLKDCKDKEPSEINKVPILIFIIGSGIP